MSKTKKKKSPLKVNEKPEITIVENTHPEELANDVKKIKNKIQKFEKNLKRSLNDTRKKIKASYKKLDEFKKRGYDPVVIDKKKIILSQMEGLLKDIENNGKEIVDLQKKFEKESSGRKRFYAGPGMVTHTILTEIQSRGNQVKALSDRFNVLANELRKK